MGHAEIEEERRGAEHDSEFYDGDRDQDGDTMPLPINNGGSSGGSNNPGGTSTSGDNESGPGK
jgi:hypothetical protein